MQLLPEIRDIAPRLTTGAFILNSGLGKLKPDEETVQSLHGAATTAYPPLKRLEGARFVRLLACTEITVGLTLLNPLVPTPVAGLLLTGFSSGLFGAYVRLPGMHQPRSLRPTEAGTVLAKDSWMVGIGVGMVLSAYQPKGRGRAGRRTGCRRWCHR